MALMKSGSKVVGMSSLKCHVGIWVASYVMDWCRERADGSREDDKSGGETHFLLWLEFVDSGMIIV